MTRISNEEMLSQILQAVGQLDQRLSSMESKIDVLQESVSSIREGMIDITEVQSRHERILGTLSLKSHEAEAFMKLKK